MELDSLLGSVIESALSQREAQADREAEIALRRQELSRQQDFEVVAERAITTAIERPDHQSQIDSVRDQFSGAMAGPVGDIKGEIKSSLNVDGAEADPNDNVAFEDRLEERVRVLYSDLTNYQVAWRIAQKIPQDLSQILKGN